MQTETEINHQKKLRPILPPNGTRRNRIKAYANKWELQQAHFKKVGRL